MKAFLIILLISTTTFAQYTYQDRFSIEDERDYFKQEGWKSLTMGLMSHGGGMICLLYGPLSNKDVLSGYIIFNTVGISLDLMAIYNFKEARKRKIIITKTPKFQ